MNAHGPAYRAGLERFRRGEAKRDEAREVVTHLLGGCATCLTATAPLWPANDHGSAAAATSTQRDANPGRYDYSGAFARADRVLNLHQLLLAEERAEVPRLREELARHPRSRQDVLAGNSSRFQTWSLTESLLEDCRGLSQADPEEALHLARLAIRLAQRLNLARYGGQRVFDLEARAWATLGLMLRVQERYAEAENAFKRARQLLREGTGDPTELAEALSLEASLWSARCQFDRAIALIDRAIAIARRTGQRELWARALAQKAKYSTDRGRPEAALPLLLEAQQHLDPSFDPRLAATVQQNILYALVETCRFEEAASGLAGTRALCGGTEHRVDRIRMDWLEGRVKHGLGRLEEAETLFRHTLDGMLGEGLDYDAALVGLDLAVLYSQQNRNSEIRELVAAMLPVFTSHRIHQQALAALLVFRKAVARERLSTELAQDLAGYLRRAAAEPRLRFKPPPGLVHGG